MLVERKAFESADFKAIDAEQGIAEMIVSVFHNVDSGQEVVMPGFFADSIANRRTADGRPRAKGVWSHDWHTPVAKTLDAKELPPGDPLLPPQLADLGGLWVRGQFNMDTQRGREAFADLKFGAIDEFSIGYQVLEDNYDPKTGIRYLLKGEWFEWSPVLLGMNAETALISVKGMGTASGSYEALSAELGEAFRAVRIQPGQNGYVYVVATYADHFVASVWMDGTDESTYWNVPYVRNADGTLTLGAAQQVEPQTEFVPVKGLGLPYEAHGGRVVSAVSEFVQRTRAGLALRRAEGKEGRAISSARRTRMEAVSVSLRSGADEIDALLAETAPPEKSVDDRAVFDALFLDFQYQLAIENGVPLTRS